ncbi:MAG: hypothetical protein JSU94_18460 [Phycisphaerales bacterium]|nr:MAG: hypothetical protein JSU94_18460 [Phycisphaerales bacterium]
MNELVKTLKNFISRDVVYFIGGFLVIATFGYCREINMAEDWFRHGGLFLLLVVGIAYVIGYAIPELLALCPFFPFPRTSLYSKDAPNLIVRFLYRCYMHEEWTMKDTFDEEKAGLIIRARASAANRDDLERRTCLFMISTTMGSCGMVAAGMMEVTSLVEAETFWCPQAIVIAICSLLLWVLGHVKLAQLTKFVHELYLDSLKVQRPEGNLRKKAEDRR